MSSTKEQTPRQRPVCELVRRAKAGDDNAFGEIVGRYQQRIYALALHITSNQCDAEDITQDVFLSAYRALERFEERCQIYTWLYRMAVNRALNYQRSRKRRRETSMEDPRVELAVAVDAAGDPVRASGLRQTYARLLWALDQLPVEIKTTIVLVILQGLSHMEAAIVQDCRPGTIAWRIHEARRRLRDILAEVEDTPVRLLTTNSNDELAQLLKAWGWPMLEPF